METKEHYHCDLEDSKHHHISPSKIGSMIPGRCQGRHRMEAEIPMLGEDRTGFGIVFHDFMRDILNEYKKTLNDSSLDTSHIKDHEMRFTIDRCIWWLKDKELLLDRNFYTELRVEIRDEKGDLVTYGTLDFVSVHDTLAVVDWKTYRSELDTTMATCQISSYICGACQHFGKNGGKGYLYLPFMDLDYTFETSMTAAREDITYIVRSAEEPDSPLVAGSWCQYCRANTSCPKVKELAVKATESLVLPEVVKSKKALQDEFEAQLKTFAANGNIVKVAEFGEMISTLEPAISAWRSVAKDLIENGHAEDFPNWEIKEKAGNRHAGVMEVYDKVQTVIPDDQFAVCASVKWGELERHYIENVQTEAAHRGHKMPMTKAKKMLNELLEPIVTRTARKELWRRK